MGFIVPSALLSQNYGKLLRQKILRETVIKEIVDFSQYKVFDAASVATTIVTLSKQTDENEREKNTVKVIQQKHYESNIQPNGDEIFLIAQKVFEQTTNNMFRLELIDQVLNVTQKLEAHALRVGDICVVITGFVAHDSVTGASKDRLISLKALSSNSKPYLDC